MHLKNARWLIDTDTTLYSHGLKMDTTLYSHGLKIRVIRTDDGCFHAHCVVRQSGSRLKVHGWHRDDYKEAIEKCVRNVRKRLFNYCNYLRNQDVRT